MIPIDIHQEPEGRTTIQLEPHQGEAIRSAIIQASNMTFGRYVEKVGLQPTNVSNYLSGRNRISLTTLYKLLAGTDLQVQCLLQVTIQSGNDVEVVDSTPLEEMLYLPEPDTVVEETMSMCPTAQTLQHSSGRPLRLPQPALSAFLQPTPTCSSSEKPPEHKKITQDSPSKDLLDEFFTQCSALFGNPSATQSPTPSDADQPPKIGEETSSTENPPPRR